MVLWSWNRSTKHYKISLEYSSPMTLWSAFEIANAYLVIISSGYFRITEFASFSSVFAFCYRNLGTFLDDRLVGHASVAHHVTIRVKLSLTYLQREFGELKEVTVYKEPLISCFSDLKQRTNKRVNKVKFSDDCF